MNSVLTQQLLENKTAFFDQLLTEKPERHTVAQLVFTAAVSFSIFGLIIGGFHGWEQAMSSAVKLPLLFFLTAAICFPTLYFFLAVFGVRCSAMQLLGFGSGALAFMGLALLAFSPASLFFLLTVQDYHLFKLLNVFIFAISGFSGVYLYLQHLGARIHQVENPASQTKARIFLKIWLLQFALIGAQLSYSLSPFFGYPEQGFLLLTNSNSDFFTDLIETLWRIF